MTARPLRGYRGPVGTEAKPTRAIVAILLGVIPLSQFPIDVYTPAIPTMVTELGTTTTLVQASVAAYVLGLAIGQLPIGILGDVLGRRRVLLVCLALLCLASVGTALSANIWMLLAFRLVEGLGGAACMVVVKAIAADVAHGPALASLSGYLGASWGLAPVVAPAIGGALVQFLSWRGIFGLTAALAAIAVVVVLRWLPETLPAEERTRLSARAVGSAIGGSLRHPLFLFAVLAFAVFAGAQLLFGVVAPVIYEVRLGIPAAVYGVFALVVGLANLGGELTTGALGTRWRHERIAWTAFGAFLLGALVLVVSAAIQGANVWAIAVGGVLALYGCGALCPLMFGRALAMFDRNRGLIAGVGSTITYLVVALVMAFASILPDEDQAPLGWVYLAVAALGAACIALSFALRVRAPGAAAVGAPS